MNPPHCHLSGQPDFTQRIGQAAREPVKRIAALQKDHPEKENQPYPAYSIHLRPFLL